MARNGNGMQQLPAADGGARARARGQDAGEALPAAAAPVRGKLDYRLVLDERRRLRRLDRGRRAAASPEANGDGRTARATSTLQTDAATFARLAAGASPLRLMLTGQLRIRGKRRRALQAAQAGRRPDDARHRARRRRARPGPALPGAAVRDRPGVDRGPPLLASSTRSTADETGPGGQLVRERRRRHGHHHDRAARRRRRTRPCSCRTRPGCGLVRGELTPNEAMQQGLVRVEGAMYPVTLVGRWIERSEGRDDAELERERAPARGAEPARDLGLARQRHAARARAIPAVEAEARRARAAQLLSYEELYALWERQNWQAHEIDFTVDKQHWLATPDRRPARHDVVDWRASTSARSASPPTSRRSCSRRRAARSRSSSPRSSWTRRATPRSSTASWPRCWRSSAEDIRGRLARDGGADAARRGAPCSTTTCAASRGGSRSAPTTSTCSSRASSPTTW